MYDKDFERIYKTGSRLFIIGTVVSTMISLAIFGFVGWVIVKVLQHFGIV